LKQQIQNQLWKMIEQHYNVDRGNPQILTAKKILSGNPIDQIGEELCYIIESLIKDTIVTTTKKIKSESESESKNDYGDDLYPYLYWED